jgi:4-amino-4-deoxy-L-arabinose transferase-like glycosyltransferase
MSHSRAPTTPVPIKPVLIFGVLALTLALRLMHLSSALQSPLSYQPGPDEDYYLRFGQAVAAGVGQDSPEFTFMDPGYGYLLGAVFKVVGVNLFAVYLLQALLDVGTAYVIMCIGRRLERPLAGLYGALLYGLTSTAILFCATLLKETCVAAFLAWWVLAALAVGRSDRRIAWLSFGVMCGAGIALRSTLLLLALFAALLPLGVRRAGWPVNIALVIAGTALALTPWSLRNHAAYGSWSPLPHNGGVVLHQAYNVDNPGSAIWIPAFVNYSHPSAIWAGYAAEAARRAGHGLSPAGTDRYWRNQALDFIMKNPGIVMGDVVRKALVFVSDSEVPNNRSSAEERLFSPVLAWLPQPAPWLLAMGLVGLVWLAIQDRRWPVVAAPVFISWATVALFWAEDRFRFHAMPLLALCSGIWLDGMATALRNARRPAGFAAAAVVVASLSLYLGSRFPPPPIRWDHVVWGYIKMGRRSDASALVERIVIEQPDNGPILEARGYLAAADRRYGDAAADLRRAIEVRPNSYLAHYNLAKALLALGDKSGAAAEANSSFALSPSADTQALITEIGAAP